MKYRIYVDEVGNPDLMSSDNPNHRFLSLTGVILLLGHVDRVVHPEMEALKREFFPYHADDPPILHRKELVNARPPFTALRDPETRARFDERLLNLLGRWDYRVVTVCIDKKRHRDTYTAWRHDPYHYCLAVLLERFVFFLERSGLRGDVLAEARGGREDRRLKASFERLVESGTDYIDPPRFQTALTSRQLKVKPKQNNIAGLQLADLIAHTSRNEILIEHGLIDKSHSPFAARLIPILSVKYDQVEGRLYGKKLL